MLQPLKIGTKIFESSLIQAPLAGISSAPFRELVWEFGGVAYCVTEMLSGAHLANGIDRSPRYHTKFKNEGALCWQLSGNDSEIMRRASERAIAAGADLLDLNCGCPQPKIRKKGCGSKLLAEEKKLTALVRAMQHGCDTPVTVKMRIDAGRGEFCEVSVAKLLEQSGVNAIIVHGRNWTHDYNTPCQLESIAKIVKSVTIPVIGNGDLGDSDSIKNMFAKTQCAGFMLARASVGQPWLYQKISAELAGEHFTEPEFTQIGQLFLKHAEGLVELEGEHNAVLQSRKLGKYYARNLPNKESFLQTLYQVKTLPELRELSAQYFA